MNGKMLFLALAASLALGACAADLKNIGAVGEEFDEIDLRLRYQGLAMASCAGASPCVTYLAADKAGLEPTAALCAGDYQLDTLCEYSTEASDPKLLSGLCEIPDDGFMRVEFYDHQAMLGAIEAENDCDEAGNRWISWTDL